ncbi:MAG TPA: hypothetical protein VHI52_18230, partial [Verrucomicrobiae bacterium]|nr:hypothetical protein [Verrucomicrobiae bacterium]
AWYYLLQRVFSETLLSLYLLDQRLRSAQKTPEPVLVLPARAKSETRHPVPACLHFNSELPKSQ